MTRTTRGPVVRAAILAVLTVFLSAAALVGPMTTAAEAYPTYCTRHNSGGTQRTTCIHITKISHRKFNVVYRDGVRNSNKGSASLTCVSEESKTITFSVSATVKTEAGAIFAKVGAEISGGISHSVTSRYGASITKKVPGKTTMFCDRGIYSYSFEGTVSKVVCVNVNCTSSTKKFKGKAPQRNLWHVYYGH